MVQSGHRLQALLPAPDVALLVGEAVGVDDLPAAPEAVGVFGEQAVSALFGTGSHLQVIPCFCGAVKQAMACLPGACIPELAMIQGVLKENIMSMNRLANCHNRFQGEHKRVLCVCSAGLLRSPTAAVVLSQPPFNFNTRAAGLDADFALIPVDRVLLEWADEVVCMTRDQERRLMAMLMESPHKDEDSIRLKCLDIDDNFEYRNPELMRLIAERYSGEA